MTEILILLVPFIASFLIEKLIVRTGARLVFRLVPVIMLGVAGLFCLYWFTGIGEESIEAVMTNREFVKEIAKPMLASLSGFIYVLREAVSKVRKGIGIAMLLVALGYFYVGWAYPDVILLPFEGPVKWGIYLVYTVVMLIML